MIELLMSNGKKCLINLFQVQLVLERGIGCVIVAGGESISVAQSYSEVCALVQGVANAPTNS